MLETAKECFVGVVVMVVGYLGHGAPPALVRSAKTVS